MNLCETLKKPSKTQMKHTHKNKGSPKRTIKHLHNNQVSRFLLAATCLHFLFHNNVKPNENRSGPNTGRTWVTETYYLTGFQVRPVFVEISNKTHVSMKFCKFMGKLVACIDNQRTSRGG